MRIRGKLLSIFLSAVLVVGLFPSIALGASAISGGTWTPVTKANCNSFDSIYFNGKTVYAIYPVGYKCSGSDTTYCCAAFVKKFYKSIWGVNVSNLIYPRAPLASSGSFSVTSNPVKGDIVATTNHWGIVKSIDGNRVTVIEQNWSSMKGSTLYAGKGRTCSKNSSSTTKFYHWSGYKTSTVKPIPTAHNPQIIPHDAFGGAQPEIKHDQGATMRYTTDGSRPSTSHGTETQGLWINDQQPSMTVQAIAYKSGMNPSGIASRTFNLATAQKPFINQTNNANGALVEITAPDRGATICYAIDGDTSDGKPLYWTVTKGYRYNGKKYTGAFQVTKNCKVTAISVVNGKLTSPIASFDVTCASPAVPEPTIASDKIAQGDSVTAKWNPDPSAASFVATLYKGEDIVDTQTATSPEATFVLSDAADYTIGVKASNSIGSSNESKRIAVRSVAPLKVRFISNYTDENGDEISRVENEQQVKYGSSAVSPRTPVRRGYSFAGWDRSFNQVYEDMDVVATWDINEYIVEFFAEDGRTSLSRQAVNFNESATAPEVNAAPTGKVFSGWAVTDAANDSSRDYTRVDSDMKLRVVYAWADEELPVVAEIVNAERTASGNYTVNVRLTNYPTDISTALLRVALKTADDKLVQTARETVEIGKDANIEKAVTLKYSGNYVASVAEVEVVGLDGNYRTGGAYSAAVKKDIVTMDNFYFDEWSEWSTEKPVASDMVEVEEGVQYRTRDRQYTTSTATTLNGWERNNERTSTSYGSWSGNQYTTSKPTASDTLRITGQSTKYTYYRWCNWYDGGVNQDSRAWGSGCTYHEVTLNSPMKACPNKFADKGGKAWDLHGPYGSCSHRREGISYWWTKSIVTTYTYQTRSKTVNYGYQKWGDWSEWNFDETPATSDHEVEKQTVYRYRTKHPGQIQGEEDKKGTKQSMTGTLAVSTDLAGKEATIMVYNVTNSDPNEDQVQYIGQTRIGPGNTYAFDFIPRRDPTVDSGDFIVALGVKGSTGLVNIATIKAPRSQYKVTYQYEKSDGTVEVVSEQMVPEGGDAQVPSTPQKEGCLFLGWSRSASSINNNVVINALFAPRSCTVAWVDYEGEGVFLQTCSYGQALTPPVEQAERDENFGYTFKGWDAILNGTTQVTENMVVTAIYEPKMHTVMFVNGDGSPFKTMQVQHGQAASLPEDTPTLKEMEFVSWGTTSEVPWWSVTSDLVVKPLFSYAGTVTSPFASAEIADGYVGAQGKKVFLETSTENAKIYYTTDGSEPRIPDADPAQEATPVAADRSFLAVGGDTEEEETAPNTSMEYNPDEGITVIQPTKIRAYACAADMNDSSIADIDVNVTATNDIANADAGVAEAPFFYGEAAEPGVMVWIGDDLLVYGEDYTIEYADNAALGTGRAIVKGMGAYTGQKEVSFDIVEPPTEDGDLLDISSATVDAIPAQTYTGSALTPELTVRYGSSVLEKDVDYTVAYSDNVNAGTATCTIEGIGGYQGSKTVTFEINAASTPDPTPSPSGTKTMYRLYNPNSGEHFYTASAGERDSLARAGWNYEGTAWTAPVVSNTPVYRLYSGTDHHYTTSVGERDSLVRVGWKYEGVGWYSDDAKGVFMHRLFNPGVNPAAPTNNSGSHHYTASKAEADRLVSVGWRYEGESWYGCK